MIHSFTEDSQQQIQPAAAPDTALPADMQRAENPLFDTLASQAFRQLLTLASLSAAEQNRAAQQIAVSQQWTPWCLGGFSFADGSVLWCDNAEWQSLSAAEALERLNEQRKRPLNVRLQYDFQGGDGRQKSTVTEARFSYQTAFNRWRLVIEYEAYMDSPLYGARIDCFADLADLNLWELRVDASPRDRWQLEQIALHPDWLELLLISSRPDRTL